MQNESMGEEIKNVGVVGSGAVGGYYGALLARAGVPVHFVARSDSHVIRTEGIQVESVLGDFSIKPASAASRIAEMPPVELLLIATKATANQEIAAQIATLTPKPRYLLVLQNGLDVENSFAASISEKSILGGCCFLCCTRTAPGKIKHLDYGGISVGAFDPRGGNASESQSHGIRHVVEFLNRANVDARAIDNLRDARWRKLLWNIAFSGLSVAVESTTAQITQSTELKSLATRLMHEVLSIANADGCDIPVEAAERCMVKTEKMRPYKSSMLVDFELGRPMELDAIFAEPLRRAKSLGIVTPCLQTIFEILTYKDASNAEALSSS